MPNRILTEDILSCEKVNDLSFEAELFFRRLLSVVDDFGRFSAHPSILRARLYPLRADVDLGAISASLRECVSAGLVVAYAVDDKPYLALLETGRPRAKTSNYPAPPDTPPGVAWEGHRENRKVYFAYEALAQAVKIGSAVDPEARVRDIQGCSPGRLALLGTRAGGEPEERRLHALFAGSRIHGEWFRLTENVQGWLESEGLWPPTN